MFATLQVLRLRVLLVAGLIAFALLVVCQAAIAQTTAQSEWTWMGGSSAIPGSGGESGVYGTVGVPALGNFPGSRQQAQSWTDNAGNLWLFGGYGYDASGNLGALADQWEFNPSTNEWTSMGWITWFNEAGLYGTMGTPAAGNFPGGRYSAVSWTDLSGNLWLFGGSGYDVNGFSGTLNDLWEFDPSTNEWAWISGSSTIPSVGGGQTGVYGTLGTPAAGNVPGGREEAVGWTDKNGNLWLFGGIGHDDSGYGGRFLNDLWEFSPSIGEWTWMGGSSTIDSSGCESGNYGTLGTPDAANIPGSRYFASSWTDKNGNFWLFGGEGCDGGGDVGWLNDLWEFNPSTNTWAWMGGSSSNGQWGVYGTLVTPAAGNIPGAREGAANWIDSSGNLWLSGGFGSDANEHFGYLNDLWEFSPATNQWTWMSGSSTVTCGVWCGNSGVYGTLGMPAAGNLPGGREYAANWTDGNGNLWLFGGNGFDAYGGFGDLNDLWTYQIPPVVSSAGAPTTTKLTSTPNPAVYGETVSLTATVSLSGGTPPNGESVLFVNSTTMFTLGKAVLSGGTASLTTTKLPAGTGAITAYYLGDATLAGSASPAVSQTVSKATSTTTLTSSQNPAGFAQQVTLTATVTGEFGGRTTGTVNFSDGGATIGSVPLNGNSAILATTTLPETSNTITAVYSGDTNLAGSTSNVLHQVVGTPLVAPLQWTWMGGSSVIPGSGAVAGVYGTLGKPAPENIPGARIPAASWTDTSGHFWLFGGGVWSEYLNDLWQFNPSTNEWTWMSGSSTTDQSGVYGTLGTPAAANIPGGRADAAQWTDLSGHLWLFGGDGIDASGHYDGDLNDLWEFNPSTNEWTWITGSSTVGSNGGQPGVYGTLSVSAAGNVPGGRYGAVSWTDLSGNLWLFGGYGFDASGNQGYLNDLWEFNPSTKEWAWMGGSSALDENACNQTVWEAFNSSTCGQPGAYGTLGSPSAANIPGGREYAATWTDSSGNFWLFGGYGYGANQSIQVTENGSTSTVIMPFSGYYNDLWEFSPATSEWTWMGGSSTIAYPGVGHGPNGVYGTLGTPAAGNVPAGRHCASRWTDKNGNLWLYGGWGIGYSGTTGTAGELNDLWKFNPSTQEWAWMSGNSNVNCTGTCAENGAYYYGVYGTLGTPAAGNLPGSRRGVSNANWTDANGNLWLFGGYGYDSVNTDPNSWDADMGGPAYLNDLWKYQPPARTTPSITWATPAAIAYGTALSATQLDASSTVAGSFVYTPASGTVLPIGTHTLSVTLTPTDTTDYKTATATVQLTVNPAPQTITFPAITGTQYALTQLTLSATASSGLAVTFSSTTTTVCTVSGSTLSLLVPGTCVLHAAQAGNSDYQAAPTLAQSFAVHAVPQTITFPAITGTQYALSNLPLTATATSGLTVIYTSTTPTVCTVSGSTASLLIAGTCVVDAAQAGNSLYAAAPTVAQSFAVHLVAQKMTFPAITQTPFALTKITLVATATSGLPVTITSITPTVCTVSGFTASLLIPGTCVLHAAQAGNSDYSPAPTLAQDFTVVKAQQSITFPAITETQYALSKVTLSATATSGLAVAFTSTTPTVCTVSGSTASLLAPGTCVLHANQAGNTLYAAASMVAQSFSVHLIAQTITFPAITGTQYAGSQLTLTATATSGLPVTYTSTTTTVCTVSGNTASLLTAGTCVLHAAQAGNSDYAAAPTLAQSFAVKAAVN
jgi:N-acetylneuraminic acid mutarotase/ribosomal protein S11